MSEKLDSIELESLKSFKLWGNFFALNFKQDKNKEEYLATLKQMLPELKLRGGEKVLTRIDKFKVNEIKIGD